MSRVDDLAEHMAKKIGHGMSEKCERHAVIAVKYFMKEINQLVAENALLRQETERAKEHAERARSLEVHWRSEVDRHAEPFNKMGRTLDKINKMIRRGFVNLGDELNYEIKELMEPDK